MRKKITTLAVLCILLVSLTGCTEAEKVSQNVSKEADNFNVCRRITEKQSRKLPCFSVWG